MDYQGAKGTRPGPAGADARQPSQAAPDNPGYGPGPGLAPGTGSGGYQVLAAGSGPLQALEPSRTPARGFPPVPPVHQDAPASNDAPASDGAGSPDPSDPDPSAPDPSDPVTTGPRRRHGTRRAGGPGRRPFRVRWIAAAAAVILAAGGYASYRLMYEPRVNAPVPASLRLPTTAAASPASDAALGKWQHISSRADDPAALSLAELYPAQFELNGSSYVRTAAATSKNCTLAVYGSDLQTALQTAHCSQVLRASYISGNGTMMGTVGVANLTSTSAAQKAGQVTGPNEIIAPLAAQKGPTSKLGNGTGVVQAEIKGHYLILMWAEFTSLKSPSTSAQRQQLEQFAADLVTGSANIDLSTRMLTGKPA